MAANLLKQFIYNGKPITFDGSVVYDQASKTTFSQHVADKSKHLTEADVQALMADLKTTVNNFLTGSADGGEMDRLVELVAAIGQNKDSIDALVSDKVAIANIVNDLTTGGAAKVLSAEQGKVLKGLIDTLNGVSHSHNNSAALAGVGVNASGDLTYNGKTLDGLTSVAVVSSADQTPVFDAKVVFVVEEIATPA